MTSAADGAVTPRSPPAGLEGHSGRTSASAAPHRDGKGYGVTLNFIPRSPDAELVIRAIEPKPAAQADA
jgi:hypothetical protein